MLVYDVSAKDVDSGDNGRVDYSFIYNGEETQETPEFRINRITGVISANIVYDRERVSRYVVRLRIYQNNFSGILRLSFFIHAETVTVFDI